VIKVPKIIFDFLEILVILLCNLKVEGIFQLINYLDLYFTVKWTNLKPIKNY